MASSKTERAVTAVLVILSVLAIVCFQNANAEEIPVPQPRSDAPWMRHMLKNPEMRQLLADYVLYRPAESKRAIIDSLGGDYLIKKRQALSKY